MRSLRASPAKHVLEHMLLLLLSSTNFECFDSLELLLMLMLMLLLLLLVAASRQGGSKGAAWPRSAKATAHTSVRADPQ